MHDRWSLASVARPRLADYRTVRGEIRSGDVMLFRRQPGRPSGRLIAVAGRGVHCHAAMAAWWDDRLMALETVQFVGGRAVLLSHLVQQNAGRIDVFAIAEAPAGFDRRAAVDAMKTIAGRSYGWWSLLCCGLTHVPALRLLMPPQLDDTIDGSLPFCSMAVAAALRRAGVDPVPNLADRLTEPGDLARSAVLEYQFTLVVSS
ncbi:MAG: hypothetical protein ACOY3P_20520 [Planctomycetota bacterium]